MRTATLRNNYIGPPWLKGEQEASCRRGLALPLVSLLLCPLSWAPFRPRLHAPGTSTSPSLASLLPGWSVVRCKNVDIALRRAEATFDWQLLRPPHLRRSGPFQIGGLASQPEFFALGFGAKSPANNEVLLCFSLPLFLLQKPREEQLLRSLKDLGISAPLALIPGKSTQAEHDPYNTA